MKNETPFVITISRQLGSGGAYVGRHLAKKLHMFYADREIISQAAREFSISEGYLEQHDERLSTFWESYASTYKYGIPEVYIPPQIIPTDRELFNIEAGIIEHTALKRPAVIVGRCGFHILREHPNHLSIFLHGAIAFRRERIRKLYGVSNEEAGKMIAQSDKERALYNHTCTGRSWTDAREYSISIDTSKRGVDHCVELIINYLN